MSSVEQSIDLAVPVRVAYDQWTQFESVRSVRTLGNRCPGPATAESGDEATVAGSLASPSRAAYAAGTPTGEGNASTITRYASAVPDRVERDSAPAAPVRRPDSGRQLRLHAQDLGACEDVRLRGIAMASVLDAWSACDGDVARQRRYGVKPRSLNHLIGW
jgi:hypothetical protein